MLELAKKLQNDQSVSEEILKEAYELVTAIPGNGCVMRANMNHARQKNLTSKT